MNLDIGCGKNKRQGFVGLDISPHTDADIIASALFLPVKDESVDSVQCFHLVEHFGPKELPLLLQEIYRVLRLGGKAELKIDRAWSRRGLLSKDPTHKYRYNQWEIEREAHIFKIHEVKRIIYPYNWQLRNKLFARLEK